MSNSNTIIGGYNNTVTSTCSSIIGGQGSIGANNQWLPIASGVCGSIGAQGTSGPGSGAYQITDWKEDIMNKYNNRFIIKTDYDAMTFAPTNIITDTKTNKEYKFTPKSISNIVEETDLFIQALITIIRDEKLTHIFNGSKD
jgi:hypothetical protein